LLAPQTMSVEQGAKFQALAPPPESFQLWLQLSKIASRAQALQPWSRVPEEVTFAKVWSAMSAGWRNVRIVWNIRHKDNSLCYACNYKSTFDGLSNTVFIYSDTNWKFLILSCSLYVEPWRKDSVQWFSVYINLLFYQKSCFGALVVMFFAWTGS